MTGAAEQHGHRRRGLVPRSAVWALILITLLGSTLRFIGIGWGLPLTLHADEWVIVEHAIDMARRNSFEPAFFARPDHLEIQLSYLAYQAWSHLFAGAPPEIVFDRDPAPFYAISRAVTAAFGSAMIPVAYAIGRRFDPRAGVLMAAAVAFFPPFVEHSRYATPDVPLTFTVMVVILGAIIYIQQGTWLPLVVACLAVSAGITAKYPAVIGTVVIAYAVIIRATRSRRPLTILSRGSAAVGMVVAGVFVISPVLFTNVTEVLRQLTGQNSDGHLGASGLGWSGNAFFYARHFLEHSGWILFAFALVGVLWIVRQRRWAAGPLLVGVVYWISISALALHWDRWGLPMYVTPLLLAGLGGWAAWTWASEPDRRARKTLRYLLIGAGILSLGALVAGSIAQTATALATDTRVAAAKDLQEEGSEATNTVYDGYTPYLPDGPASVASALSISADGSLEAEPLTEDVEIEYILTSSYMVSRYISAEDRPEGEVYRAISAELDPLATWPSIGAPPGDPFEVIRLVESATYVIRALGGELVGPHLVLYPLP